MFVFDDIKHEAAGTKQAASLFFSHLKPGLSFSSGEFNTNLQFMNQIRIFICFCINVINETGRRSQTFNIGS